MQAAALRRNHENAARDPAVVRAVEAVLSLPEDELNYARAKVTFDKIVDPEGDEEWTFAQVDRLTQEARTIAGADANEIGRLNAVRTILYEAGPWNGHRPFAYDHAGFKDIRVKLMSQYLATRLGNCVSMPILFLILADKLDLDVSLAMAPAHLFLKWQRPNARTVNLEATSGAGPARDAWVRQTRGVTERGEASGFYMRALNRREALAAMALTVVEHLMAERRFREALKVTELILRCNSRDGFAWAHQGNACERILKSEFLDPYRSQFLIPAPLRAAYLVMLQRNHSAFATARRLGWEPLS